MNTIRIHSLWIFALAGIWVWQARAADKSAAFSAEDKQSAQEDADEAAERAKGVMYKHQRLFFGTFRKIPQPDDTISPNVVGTFTTNKNDKKPGRTYLVKVDHAGVLDLLKRYDGKSTQFRGKLRVLGADGEAKYLIVSQVLDLAPTPKPVEHVNPGGL